MHYMQAGWRIIPLHRVGPDRKTCSCKEGGKCTSAGKHPKALDWSKTEPMSAADVHATWDTKYAPNLGVVTGHPSGFWVLDIDPGAGGFESYRRLVEDNEKPPSTLRHKTGSGGFHLIFKMVDGFEPKTASNVLKSAGYPGIDVRGVGGQIVLPPSRSDKGDYTIAADVPIADAPDWLIAMLPQVTDEVEFDLGLNDLAEYEGLDEYDRGVSDRYVDAAIGGVIKNLEALPRPWEEGAGWDQGTHRAACRLFELAQQSWSKLTYIEAVELLVGHAPQDSEWGVAEIQAKWAAAQNSVGKKPMPRPRGKRDDNEGWGDLPVGSPKAPADQPDIATPEVRPRTWDDFGNAERLNDRHPQVIKWIEEAGTWAHYDGTAWRMDRMNQVPSMAHDVLVHLVDDESQLYSDVVEEEEKLSMRDQFTAWAGKQRMYARLEATLKTARSLRPLAAHMTDFDADPMILNCRNAAVDLRTGALIPHSPDLMAMHQASVEYDPDAKAPQWEAFLERVLPSEEMRSFLARAVGYTLNGLTGEQVMFMHHGSGANGKSVFLKVMEEILGDYAQTVPRTTLLTSKNEGIPTDVARMVGKRFLQTSETAAGRRLDEEVIKGLTGGEKQTARFLHRDFFDFTPTGTIHYVTNHLPRLTNAESIWRRLILIGWNVVIPAEERDQHLADRIIRDEAAGVLAWAIRGAVDYQQNRLAVPDECRLALEQYREDVDLLGDFVKECLITDLDDRITTPVSRIYDAYQAWTFRSGIRNPMVVNDLSAALVDRGFKRPGKDGRAYVDGKQQRCFTGVGLSVNTTTANAGVS